MKKRRATTHHSLSSDSRIAQIARQLFDMKLDERLNQENILISQAIGDGYDVRSMAHDQTLKLEWTMLESTVNQATLHMKLSKEKNFFALHVAGVAEYHLPYTADGIHIAKAIVRIYCP